MTAEKSNEIKLTRLYNAPLKKVWEVWTDPAHAAKWWGPRGFTLTSHSKDLRAGGTWDYTMHGPDGKDYPNLSQYYEVEKYARLVYDHGASKKTPPLFHVTVLFSEINGKTKMNMTMKFDTPEIAEKTRGFIKQVGGDATWDRLAEYLEKESSGKEIFVINRSFAAPRDVVFEMWKNPDHFAQWLAPTGFAMKFMRPAEIKPGASAFYQMTDGKTITMYGKVHYKEINPPKNLLYTQQFCDENEKVTRHYAVKTWPETMLTRVEFEEEGANQTRVIVTWEPYGKATPEEIDTFVKSRGGMTLGWTGSFDKLDAYLKVKN